MTDVVRNSSEGNNGQGGKVRGIKREPSTDSFLVAGAEDKDVIIEEKSGG